MMNFRCFYILIHVAIEQSSYILILAFTYYQIIIGRKNDLKECLPILKKNMSPQDYQKLLITKSPKFFLETVGTTNEDVHSFFSKNEFLKLIAVQFWKRNNLAVFRYLSEIL